MKTKTILSTSGIVAVAVILSPINVFAATDLTAIKNDVSVTEKLDTNQISISWNIVEFPENAFCVSKTSKNICNC